MQWIKSFNVPNKLTLIRIILVIPIIILISINATIFFANKDVLNQTNSLLAIMYLIFNILIFIIFITAMITDYYDGKIARKNRIITAFGKLWDPLADKIMTTSVLIYLSVISYTPIWSTVLFILRDIIVDGCRGLLIKNNQEISANFWGKLKTLLMSFAIPILLLFVIIMQFIPNISYYHSYLYYWIYIINIPLFIAQLFSLFSGYIYIKLATKFFF
ncbi:CDP-diacylglycerol--glycerol-3-phosphate 3-phosphatidyltransferase [Mycoplasma sp. 6243]|uniref:CDP-diacylglycerol--glycerol-3-phosphate 3-phosphatidyltransferase n=1 Tax=Mycoplasma sp. 6243 TaxID=3440865 RepID=UPI003EBC9197